MKFKDGKKQNILNLCANILAFLLQFAVSLYVSPRVVANCGVDANGFINLANDMVSYMAIVGSIFNSVAARFISIHIYKKEAEKANSLFNSLFLTNVLLSGLIAVVGTVITIYINHIYNVSDELLFPVQLTFALTIGAYFVTLLTSTFTVSTYVTNRTDLQGYRNCINQIVRVVLIFLFFLFISVQIYWVALAGLVGSIVMGVLNVGLTKKLTPELSVKPKTARWAYVKTLAKSGLWLAFINLTSILIRGVDLTIANVVLGETQMGYLSVSRTLPNAMTGIIFTIGPLFGPALVALYAKNDIDGVVRSTKKAGRTMASILFVPIIGIIVFGPSFYGLWQSSLSIEETQLIANLSAITIAQAIFNSMTYPLSYLSVVADKNKIPAIVNFACGVLNVGLVLLLLNTTSLGLYAIVIPATIIMSLRYFIYNPWFGAHVLKLKKWTFFPSVFINLLPVPFVALTMWLYVRFVPTNTWITFILGALACAAICYGEIFGIFWAVDKIVFKTNGNKTTSLNAAAPEEMPEQSAETSGLEPQGKQETGIVLGKGETNDE